MTENVPPAPVDRTPGWLKFIAKHPGIVIPLILVCGGLGINLIKGHAESSVVATPEPVSTGTMVAEVDDTLYVKVLPEGEVICGKADNFRSAHSFNDTVKEGGYRGEAGPDVVWVVGEDGQGEWRDAILSLWYVQSLESQGITELCVWPSSTDGDN